jgi:hypothetical protein
MKKLIVAAALAVTAFAASAQTNVTGNFDVKVTLTSVCKLASGPGNLDMTYTSFQTGGESKSTNFDVLCTDGLAYSMALSDAGGTLLGLPYTLAIRNAGDTANVTTATQSGATAATYKIKAAIASGLQGSCNNPVSCNATDSARVLTITY